MVTFVLDTSAIFRYVDNEAGADRVTEIFQAQASGTARIVLSAIHWGEVAGIVLKRQGTQAVDTVLTGLRSLPLEIVPATANRAERCAFVKFKYKIPYADAFGVELAGTSPDHILVTADFDVKPAAQDISIEFLPLKPKA